MSFAPFIGNSFQILQDNARPHARRPKNHGLAIKKPRYKSHEHLWNVLSNFRELEQTVLIKWKKQLRKGPLKICLTAYSDE